MIPVMAEYIFNARHGMVHKLENNVMKESAKRLGLFHAEISVQNIFH